MITWKKTFLMASSIALSGIAFGAVADETGIGLESAAPLAPLEDESRGSDSLWDEIAEWFENAGGE